MQIFEKSPLEKKDKLGVHISLFSKVVAIFKVEGY